MPHGICQSQRTVGRSWLSHSTMWARVSSSGHQAKQQVPLPSGSLSCWPKTLLLNFDF